MLETGLGLVIPLAPTESMIFAPIVISKTEVALSILKFRVLPFRSNWPAFVPVPVLAIKPDEVPVPVKFKSIAAPARNFNVPGAALSDSKLRVGLLLLPVKFSGPETVEVPMVNVPGPPAPLLAPVTRLLPPLISKKPNVVVEDIVLLPPDHVGSSIRMLPE